MSWLDHATDAIGIYRNTKPSVNELELEEGLTVLAFTDGVWGLVPGKGAPHRSPAILLRHDPDLAAPAGQLADSVLAEALSLDHGPSAMMLRSSS